MSWNSAQIEGKTNVQRERDKERQSQREITIYRETDVGERQRDRETDRVKEICCCLILFCLA